MIGTGPSADAADAAPGAASRSSRVFARSLRLLHRRLSPLGQPQRALALRDRRRDGRVARRSRSTGPSPRLGDHEDKAESGRPLLLEQGAGPRVRGVSRSYRAAPALPAAAERGPPDATLFLPASADRHRSSASSRCARFSRRLEDGAAPGGAAPLVTARRGLRHARFSSTRAPSSPTPGRRRCSFSRGTCFAAREARSAARRVAAGAGAGLLAGLGGDLGVHGRARSPFCSRCALARRRGPAAGVPRSRLRGAVPLARCCSSTTPSASARRGSSPPRARRIPRYAALASRGLFGFGLPTSASRCALPPRTRRAALLLFSPFLLWVLRGARGAGGGRAGGARTGCSSAAAVALVPRDDGLPELARRLVARETATCCRSCSSRRCRSRGALETPLSRGLFVAAASFSVAAHLVLTAGFAALSARDALARGHGLALVPGARLGRAQNLGMVAGLPAARVAARSRRAVGRRRLAVAASRARPTAARRAAVALLGGAAARRALLLRRARAAVTRAGSGARACSARSRAATPSAQELRARRARGRRRRPSGAGAGVAWRLSGREARDPLYSADLEDRSSAGSSGPPRRIALCERKSSRTCESGAIARPGSSAPRPPKS